MPFEFHRGEQAMQVRAGVQLPKQFRFVRDAMPDEHREFFAELFYVIVGALDASAPFATMLVGPPGFVASPDPRTLVIQATPAAGDPIAAGLRVGAPVGLLGIQLHSRRRNRANGVIAAIEPGRITIAIRESFGNCPQYIQTRTPLAVADRTHAAPEPFAGALAGRAAEVITAADTLFIASAHGDDVDVSHRGGKPGFVRISDTGTTLVIPDFSGNNFFMTLGNLYENPRAGLAIVDFASGALVSLTGTTEIVFDGPELAAFAGAERLVRFHVARGILLDGAIPFTWSEPGFAKQLGRTGSWGG
ncbi:MAG: pyridoxamine 5'-phosphate oxidase family protein [Kofleriaceae bacterium]